MCKHCQSKKSHQWHYVKEKLLCHLWYEYVHVSYHYSQGGAINRSNDNVILCTSKWQCNTPKYQAVCYNKNIRIQWLYVFKNNQLSFFSWNLELFRLGFRLEGVHGWNFVVVGFKYLTLLILYPIVKIK